MGSADDGFEEAGRGTAGLRLEVREIEQVGRVGMRMRVGLGRLRVRGVWRGHNGHTTKRVEKKRKEEWESRVGDTRRAGSSLVGQEHSTARLLHLYVPRIDAMHTPKIRSMYVAMHGPYGMHASHSHALALHARLPVRCRRQWESRGCDRDTTSARPNLRARCICCLHRIDIER